MSGKYSQKDRYGKNSYDCSSFVCRLWQKAGYAPAGETTVEIRDSAKADGRFFKDRGQLQPGDAVLIKGGPPNNMHMGVYIGGGIVRQASSNGGVKETPLGMFQRPGFIGYVKPKRLRSYTAPEDFA